MCIFQFELALRHVYGNTFIDDRLDQDYEEVIDEDIIHAPIIDICVIHANEEVPVGYYRISKSLSRHKAVYNNSSHSNNNNSSNAMFLCIRKDPSYVHHPGQRVGSAPNSPSESSHDNNIQTTTSASQPIALRCAK